MAGPGKMFHHLCFQEADAPTRASITSHVYYYEDGNEPSCNVLVNTSRFSKPTTITNASLPDETPSNCTPSGVEFKNKVYVFYRQPSNNAIAYVIVGALKPGEANGSGVLAGPTAQDAIFPYATKNYLHLFYRGAGNNVLTWVKYDSNLKLINSRQFSGAKAGNLTGYPSVAPSYATTSSGYLAMNSGNVLAVLRVIDFDQMTTSDGGFHRVPVNISIQYSPSMVGWWDESIQNYYFCIFYQSAANAKQLRFIKFQYSAEGDVESWFKDSSIDGISIRTSPFAILNLQDHASGASSAWKNISSVYYVDGESNKIKMSAIDMITGKAKYIITPKNCGGTAGSFEGSSAFESGFMKVADPNAAVFAFPSALDFGPTS